MLEQLLIRYLTHTCSPEESKQVEDWAMEKQENAALLFDLEYWWNLHTELHYLDKEILEDKFQELMFALKQRREWQFKIKNKTLEWKRWRFVWMVAASIAIVVALIVNLYFLFGVSRPLPVASKGEHTVVVPYGEQAQVILADGTKVFLNSDSRLTYAVSFNESRRNVKLEGEGFFEVASDSLHPFVVHTLLADVRVLGTQLNVRSYPQEELEVGLLTGKAEIEISKSKYKLLMKPGERIVYSFEKGVSTERDVRAAQIVGWKEGEIIYTRKKLVEICRDLERRFAVKIVIKDKALCDQLFTCHCKKGTMLIEVLKLLKATNRVDYKWFDGEVYLFALNTKERG